jgi:AcrR family transcriptional regulator
MPPAAQPTRRTQAERRATTRRKLLDAALACLVESGYASLTTPEVCRAAGVSQGALFKHFATKSALLAAATEHLFAGLRQGYAERFAAPDVVADPIGKGVQLLWEVFQDPRLHAAYDLYTAARTDRELRASLAPVVRQHSEDLHGLARALLGDLVSAEDRLDDAVDLAMLALQGLVLNEMAHRQPGSRERALAVLTELAGALLRGTDGGKERKRS